MCIYSISIFLLYYIYIYIPNGKRLMLTDRLCDKSPSESPVYTNSIAIVTSRYYTVSTGTLDTSLMSTVLFSFPRAAIEPPQRDQVPRVLHRGERAEHRLGAGGRRGPLPHDQGEAGGFYRPDPGSVRIATPRRSAQSCPARVSIHGTLTRRYIHFYDPQNVPEADEQILDGVHLR